MNYNFPTFSVAALGDPQLDPDDYAVTPRDLSLVNQITKISQGVINQFNRAKAGDAALQGKTDIIEFSLLVTVLHEIGHAFFLWAQRADAEQNRHTMDFKRLTIPGSDRLPEAGEIVEYKLLGGKMQTAWNSAAKKDSLDFTGLVRLELITWPAGNSTRHIIRELDIHEY